MKAYLIEAGRYFIIFVQERKQYFFVDEKNYLTEFMSAQPNFERWSNGQSFIDLGEGVSADEMMKKFYDPEYNIGAVIAWRDSQSSSSVVIHKHRFTKLLKQYALNISDSHV